MTSVAIVHEIQLDGYCARFSGVGARLQLGTYGSYGIEQLHIELGESWQGLVVYANFVTSDGTTPVLVPESGLVDVPPEATAKPGTGSIVLDGTADGVRIYSVNIPYIMLNHSDLSGEAPAPTPDKWEQYIAQVQSIVDKAVPPDGTVGYVLTKGVDGNTWAPQTGGGGGGGNEPVPPSTDGKTRLYITLPASAMEGEPPPRADVPLYISQTVANGVSIDWGDGSPAQTLNGTGNVNTTHHYNAAGDYVIALTVAEGCELGLGWEMSSYCVMGSTDNSDSSNGASGYRTMLKMCSIGSGVTSIGNRAFYYCYSLSSVNILDSVTSIGRSAFSSCYGLSSVNIPDNVTGIGSSAFYYCYSLKYVYFNSSTPPAIQSTTFNSVANDCIFSIPAGSLSAYQSATNYTGYAFEERAV